jgi:hypothetical protein
LFGYIAGMTWQEKIAQWRELSPAERKARRWKQIPQQVAASMAFEGEPVSFEWLKALHNRRTPRVS